MPELVEFKISYNYPVREIGIVLETILTNGDTSVDVRARLDTSSSFCIFRRDLAEELGFVVETGIPLEIGTATGSFRVFGFEVELTVLETKTVSTVYFAESEYFDRNVLGRTGFLDRVKIGIIDPESLLLLSKYEQD
ncbi:MAG TPA: hypothetical protein PKA82_08495 [Pyrinomonadaceae bacterium]|nr:hypothetical protein [Pyrinomonadaceae bacterium]